MSNEFEEGLASLVPDEENTGVIDSNTQTLDPEREADDKVVMPKIDENLTAKSDEDIRASWPEIVIDEEAGKPNYECVTVNGKCYQIMRGHRTKVPPEVLHVLENAIAGRMVEKPDPMNPNRSIYDFVDYPSIPYRVTKFAGSNR